MSNIDETRKKIDEIDQAMLKLFEARMHCIEEVADFKKANKMAVYDPIREAEIIKKAQHALQNSKYQDAYIQFQKSIMEESKAFQLQKITHQKIGYQGIKGAFSYIASCQKFPHSQIQGYETFADVIKAIQNNEISKGVLPFENSQTGAINEVLDILMQYEGVYIQANYEVKIEQNLLGIKGAKLKDINQVYSKDQAFYQTHDFFKGRDIECIPYANTALAAKHIAECGAIHKGAVAAKETAELYDLDILVANINTNKENTTRFIVLGKKLPKTGDMFSILFTTKHIPGALLRAMNIISKGGFNMQSISSRPRIAHDWEYCFYAEIAGDLSKPKEQALIQNLSKECDYVRILGAYTYQRRDNNELY